MSKKGFFLKSNIPEIAFSIHNLEKDKNLQGIRFADIEKKLEGLIAKSTLSDTLKTMNKQNFISRKRIKFSKPRKEETNTYFLTDKGKDLVVFLEKWGGN